MCLWAYWASCGPESWPMVRFLVVFKPWGPSRWHLFFFLALFILFCFYLQQNTYCCYFFSSFFVLFSALFIFFCVLLYFLILYAFSFRKIINFLLMPLLFKLENTFFVFFVALFILFCFYL